MGKITRWILKTFGSTGNVAEFGQIGSDTVGSPVNTKDPATMQALAGYLSGLFSITASGTQAPRLEDLNSLFYLITHQFAYLMQAGVPEWHVDQDYYTGGMARVGSKVYIALTGTDVSPNVGNDPSADAVNWKNFMDAADLVGTLSLDRLPTNLTGKKASGAVLADSATTLQTPRKIGGVNFNGSADINLPGVNQAGNQNTSGKAATAGAADTAAVAGSCSGNAATATLAATATNALACSGNAATATTAATCSGNAATATTAAACSGNAATATSATDATNAVNVNLASRPVSGNQFLAAFTTDADGNQHLKRGPRVNANSADENTWYWFGRSAEAASITLQSVPANSTSSGAKGQIAADSSYLYICIATNTWRRVSISAWA